ncbi:MAG: DUF1624 domain-containing protein [Aquamicrobium sp.]|uniref:heparan-alpha-glucosaminide N-acetyltransferase n=1 Tax=Aquamicrobium sp. TaxID=1872579 RepID=UPI00349ECE92|nr:DUF1624 domain-containing protein [Aquamicrobium sp.]MCO5159422.1 DUF1624 domain-containing protein [Aquamicrobium sp.]
MPVQRSTSGRPRLDVIDLSRGVALVAMAIYHFAWDLEFFGYAPPGMTAEGGWKLFARCIASSFLFLVGVSLWLAHARGMRWRPFLKRLAMVAAAAAAISLATWLAVPGGFIFFGILHQIALASLLGLAFLRLPAWATLIVAVLVAAAPHFLRSDFFDHPALWWVGLSSANPRSNDYVPLFPWFSAVLTGIAAARIADKAGLFARLGDVSLSGWSRPLRFAGRHSLAVYLIHQPVLIGALWLFAQVAPAGEAQRETQFTRACAVQCEATHDAAFCGHYCLCVLGDLSAEGLFDEVYAGTQGPQATARLHEIVSACTFEAETSGAQEEGQ